jgi:hypothetical protein
MIKETIDAETFLQLLSSSKEDELHTKLRTTQQLSVEYDLLGPYAKLDLYYEGQIDGKPLKQRVTQNDVNIALCKYAEGLDCDLKSYKYLSGVRTVGLFIRRNIPYFNGITVNLKEREMIRKLKNTSF